MQAADRIADRRVEADFKGMSFSGYKAVDVIRKLKQACAERSVESACHWSAEMLCAGHIAPLWECVSIAAGERHATASPRVPMFIALRFSEFKRIVESGYAGQELELRNSAPVRKMFAEIIAVLCTARRHHPPQLLTVSAERDFDLGNLAGRLEASGTSFAADVFREGDPKELFVAVNELCYHLRPQRANTVSACYWTEWIGEFTRYCSSKKRALVAARREFEQVPEKTRTDPIWIAWDAMRKAAALRGPLHVRGTDALLTLYGIRYTAGCKKRRRHILYAAVSYATEDIDFSVPLVADPQAIRNIVAKAASVYRGIKKNEVPAGPREATSVGARTNRDRTAERLMRLDALLEKGAHEGTR